MNNHQKKLSTNLSKRVFDQAKYNHKIRYPLSTNKLVLREKPKESTKNMKTVATNRTSPMISVGQSQENVQHLSKEEDYLRELSELQKLESNPEASKETNYLRELSLLQEQEKSFENPKATNQDTILSQSSTTKEQDLLIELKNYCNSQNAEWRERQIRYMTKYPHIRIDLNKPWDPNAIA